MEHLLAHTWPGNVRELKNAIERAALLAGGGTILPTHLPPEVAEAQAQTTIVLRPRWERRGTGTAAGGGAAGGDQREDAEKELIRSDSREHRREQDARRPRSWGISLKTMHNKVKKYGL
jgi:DNA-binding NtrC family response regulator